MIALTGFQLKKRLYLAAVLIAAGITISPPAGHCQASRIPVTATRAPSALQRPVGTVAGYIFWDQTRVTYKPSVPCQGLQLELDVITGTGIQKFATLNQLQFMQSPRPGPNLGLCSYSFHEVPEGVALQVQVTVDPSVSHVTAKGPLGATGGLIKVPGGQCNNSSTGTALSSTYLESGWLSCGEHAYNVNFELVPGGTIGVLSRQGPPLLEHAPTASMPSKSTLLQSNPQPGGPVQSNGMLATAPGSPKVATPTTSASNGTKSATSAIAQGKLKLGPPKSGPKVANPLATQKSSAFLAQLDQQRKADDKELSEIKPRIAASTAAPRTGTGAMTQAPAPSTLLKPAGPGTIGTEKTTASVTSSSTILRAPTPLNNFALVCAQDPTMRILNVSGSYHPATFTTIKQYDSYTITGCTLGDPGPNAKVYLYKDLYKGTGFPLQFQILEWHDNWIHLQLDWNLTGLFDQDNLTLVVQRADGKQASKGGFKFVAAREETRLRMIPRQDFSLWGLTTAKTSEWKVTYNSPASATDGWGFQGMSSEVQWNEQLPFMKNNFDTANAPSGGRDVYDFSRLQPGFVPTNASLEWQPNVCYAGTLFTSGNFNLTWQTSQLWVDWQGQNCANVGCGGGAFQDDCFQVPNTTYGLDVWVEGPRGLDPWTGLPTKP